MESGGAKSAEESECESEDGMEGDAVLSDYESAEDSEGEEDYSEEENSKVELKSEANDAADSSAKEKGEEKPESKGTVTGERQSGDGQSLWRTKWGKKALSTWMTMRIGKTQPTSPGKGSSLSTIFEDRLRRRKSDPRDGSESYGKMRVAGNMISSVRMNRPRNLGRS